MSYNKLVADRAIFCRVSYMYGPIYVNFTELQLTTVSNIK